MNRIAPSIGLVIGLGAFACGLTMLFYGMRAVMDIGGFCAQGGPFEIAHHCPQGTGVLAIGGIWMAIVGAIVYVWQAVRHRVPSFAALLWSALFLALGWNFLEFGLDPPGVGGGLAWGWLVCAIVFGAMGGIPAVFFTPWVVRGFMGNATPRPWQSFAAPPGSARAVTAILGTARRRTDAGADGSDVVSLLQRLDELCRSGALDDDQYEAAKRRVLGGERP